MDALSTMIQFGDAAGNDLPGFAFQNFHVNQTRSFLGRSFAPAGFGYTGASVDINAANIEARLVFTPNDLIRSIAEQGVQLGWIVRIWTVWLNPDTLNETSDMLSEVFSVVNWTRTPGEFSIRLGSPLDAQSAEIPARVLSRRIVGDLPPSGTIEFL